MGLFDKIKDILFEEEEVEIPVITKETKQEAEQVKVVKEEREIASITPPVKEEVVPQVSKVELPEHRPEKKFDFPVFDEEEFEETRERATRNSNVLNYEKRLKQEKKPDWNRFDAKKSEEPAKKPFRPSPVISPVYGILDKNYTKEDLIEKESKHVDERQAAIDIDVVRRKAYGSLAEHATDEPVLREENKTIEDLLTENAEVTIPVEEDASVEDFSSDINAILEDEMQERPLPEEDTPSLEVLDQKKKSIADTVPSEEQLENDTLESDLFDLIDSMYEQREEGEN